MKLVEEVVVDGHWTKRTYEYNSSNTTTPRWIPCSACGGTGGWMTNVPWALDPQWNVCCACMGGGGVMVP